MPRRYVNPAEGNHRYQRDLAKALVDSLGFDAALEACLSNGWEGILRVLHAGRPTASIQDLC